MEAGVLLTDEGRRPSFRAVNLELRRSLLASLPTSLLAHPGCARCPRGRQAVDPEYFAANSRMLFRPLYPLRSPAAISEEAVAVLGVPYFDFGRKPGPPVWQSSPRR